MLLCDSSAHNKVVCFPLPHIRRCGIPLCFIIGDHVVDTGTPHPRCLCYKSSAFCNWHVQVLYMVFTTFGVTFFGPIKILFPKHFQSTGFNPSICFINVVRLFYPSRCCVCVCMCACMWMHFNFCWVNYLFYMVTTWTKTRYDLQLMELSIKR